MIDGLRLTFSGEEVRALLEERIRSHEQQANRWNCARERTAAEATEDEPLLPDYLCEDEAERHTWRANVLAFMRDHVDPAESYRLGAADLEHGELLPEKPSAVEHDEDAERTRIGFNLERLVNPSMASQWGWLRFRTALNPFGRNPVR